MRPLVRLPLVLHHRRENVAGAMEVVTVKHVEVREKSMIMDLQAPYQKKSTPIIAAFAEVEDVVVCAMVKVIFDLFFLVINAFDYDETTITDGPVWHL
jgi:hypothetical protein